HKGLSYYTEREIVIRIKGKKFFVKGESLYVKEINEDELLVCGRILSFGVVE
ncbi:MAG: YabP/YqfC family sporulation protein, partial [Clostridia bacterium]|nr:YabP/YqfC family sporulation protein [Clostridia bacterium]